MAIANTIYSLYKPRIIDEKLFRSNTFDAVIVRTNPQIARYIRLHGFRSILSKNFKLTQDKEILDKAHSIFNVKGYKKYKNMHKSFIFIKFNTNFLKLKYLQAVWNILTTIEMVSLIYNIPIPIYEFFLASCHENKLIGHYKYGLRYTFLVDKKSQDLNLSKYTLKFILSYNYINQALTSMYSFNSYLLPSAYMSLWSAIKTLLNSSVTRHAIKEGRKIYAKYWNMDIERLVRHVYKIKNLYFEKYLPSDSADHLQYKNLTNLQRQLELAKQTLVAYYCATTLLKWEGLTDYGQIKGKQYRKIQYFNNFGILNASFPTARLVYANNKYLDFLGDSNSLRVYFQLS